MSNASNTMTQTLNKTTSVEDVKSEMLQAAEEVRKEMEKNGMMSEADFKRNRRNNTIAAVAGGVVGVGLHALDKKSNNLTLGLTAGISAVNVADVYFNKNLHTYHGTDVAGHIGVGMGKAVVNSLFGFALGRLLGNKETEIEEITIEEEEATQPE